jgi:hypothetical protein
MIHELEKLDVIKKAREWAKAERRLRASELTFGEERVWASRESDRTEEALLQAVNTLEYREERGSAVLTFLGEPVEIGKPVTESLYNYLKSQVPMGPSWWSIR